METEAHKCSCGCDQAAFDKHELPQRWLIMIFALTLGFISLKPLIVSQMSARAQAYISSGMYIQAQRVYSKALWFDGRNAAIWDELGYLFQLEGDADAAFGAYTRAVMIDGKQGSARLALAMMLVSRGRCLEAREHVEYLRKTPLSQMKRVMPGINYQTALETLSTACANR